MSVKSVKIKQRGISVYEMLGIEKSDDRRRGKTDSQNFRRQKPVVKKTKQLVPYCFNPDAPWPVRGQSVAVCHRSVQDRFGVARLRRSDIEHRVIDRVYMSDVNGFSIRDNQGDTWYIRPASIGSSRWETFVPGEKQKVFK